MGISIGSLRERVDIQEPNETRVAGGGSEKVWNSLGTVWAQVLPGTGSEAFAQGLSRQTQFFKITIRRQDGLTPRNRLVWRGQALNIRSISDPDGRREALLISAESGAPEPA